MKALLLAMLVFITNPAFADEPIRAQGQGKTFEEARTNAFKTAIEIKVGSAVVSEQEMSNDKLRDDILNYSAGYVDKYEVVNKFQTNEGYRVIVDVWVSSSVIQNRILGISKSPTKLDGDRISTQYQTYLRNKQTGDKLMNQILRDYPTKAYKVAVGAHRLRVDINRNGVLEVPIEMRWSYNYIAALNEALSVLQDDVGMFTPAPGNVVTMVKNPDDFVFGKKSHFKFNDVVLTNNIRQTLQTRVPQLLLEIKGAGNNVLYAACFSPNSVIGKHDAFYSTGDTLVFFGNMVERNKIILTFSPEEMLGLQQSYFINVNVVPHEKCQ